MLWEKLVFNKWCNCSFLWEEHSFKKNVEEAFIGTCLAFFFHAKDVLLVGDNWLSYGMRIWTFWKKMSNPFAINNVLVFGQCTDCNDHDCNGHIQCYLHNLNVTKYSQMIISRPTIIEHFTTFIEIWSIGWSVLQNSHYSRIRMFDHYHPMNHEK